jgi:hypothetical protein
MKHTNSIKPVSYSQAKNMSLLTGKKKLITKTNMKPKQNEFRMWSKKLSADEWYYGKDDSLVSNKLKSTSVSSRRGCNRSSLYTRSNKRESLLSENNWTSMKQTDPRKLMKVQSMVKERLLNPNNETKVNLEDYFDADLALKKNPETMLAIYNTENKVFVSTRFDRRQIKESNIPLEALFNETVDQIKQTEQRLKMRTSKLL